MRLIRVLATALVVAATAGVVRAETAYEQPPVLKASEILTPAELKGPYHRVREQVAVRDYLAVFEIESDYGLLTAPSRRLLRTRLHEIEILATAGRSSQAGEVFRGLENSLRRTGTEAVSAIQHPFSTVQRLPQAAYNKTFGRLKGAFGSSEASSRYKDSWASSALYGADKRRVAGELKLDPYSTNPAVQQVLNQLAQARSVGSWAVDLSGQVLPDAISWSRSALDAQAEVKNIVLSNSPDDVDKVNDGKLAALGVSTYARRKFAECPWLSPTHKTIITAAAGRLRGVDDLEALLVAAAEATDEARAVVQTVQATMLAGFHAKQGSLQKLDAVGGVVIATTQGGHVFIVLPIDYGTFDAHTEGAVRVVFETGQLKAAPSRTLYVTGRVSPALEAFLKERDVRLFQGVEPPALR